MVELRDPHGPSKRTAKLVFAETWRRRGFRQEICTSIEDGVARVLPRGAVKVIGTGFSSDVDHATQHRAEFGAIGVRNDFEFLNGIEDWRDGVAALIGEKVA